MAQKLTAAVESLAKEYVVGAASRAAAAKRDLRAAVAALGCDAWLVELAVQIAGGYPHVIGELQFVVGLSCDKSRPAGYFHNCLRDLCQRHGIDFYEHKRGKP